MFPIKVYVITSYSIHYTKLYDNSSLKALQNTLQGFDRTFGAESPLNYNIPKLSEELSLSLRSLRSLLDYLERNPQALILGKEGDKK